MYSYLKGKVTEQTGNTVTLEVNGIGYMIYVANPFVFPLEEEITIYVYHHIREDEQSLYGFKTMEEKELFLKLIGVKGLGPKMALPMFAAGSVSGIVDAIDRENILYLKKFPKIGEKVARQMILDLKGKLASVSESGENTSGEVEELISVLESLGYKNADIKKVLPHVNATLPIEGQVKDALKLLLK